MTTEKAFEELINSRQFGSLTGMSRQEAWMYRKRYKAGQLGQGVIESLLEKAGYPVIQEREYGPRAYE